jgi:uncharacterized protein YbjT (DUF2867 family)
VDQQVGVALDQPASDVLRREERRRRQADDAAADDQDRGVGRRLAGFALHGATLGRGPGRPHRADALSGSSEKAAGRAIARCGRGIDAAGWSAMTDGQRIAVAGATGRVGRHVVDVLAARGHDVVPMSRSHGVDVVTGEGLAAAVDGADCVIDAAGGSSPDGGEATRFFTAAARNLQDAAHRGGARRIVLVSIIGIDGFTGGYNAAKRAHEQAMAAGPVPVRVLRAAQFHELVGVFVDWGRDGAVSRVPVMRTQLVAAATVAEALADLATAAEAPERSEIAGPQPEDLVEAARLLVAHRGDPVRIEPVTDPADPDARLYVDGALLPGPGAVLAGPTFAEWLRS